MRLYCTIGPKKALLSKYSLSQARELLLAIGTTPFMIGAPSDISLFAIAHFQRRTQSVIG
jgi:hypothetical protein